MKFSLRSERFLWMSVTTFLLLIALFALQKSQRDKRTAQRNEARTLRDLSRDKAALMLRVRVLETGGLTIDDIAELKKRGLKNPLSDLRNDLTQRAKLIPFKGVLGGKMGFYDRDAVHILNRQWALAAFDDGHVTGQALLKYDVASNGTISWRVLDAFLD